MNRPSCPTDRAVSGLEHRARAAGLDWPTAEARELGALRKYRALLKATEPLVIDDRFLRRLPATAAELDDVRVARRSTQA